jgi:hypothetical protein
MTASIYTGDDLTDVRRVTACWFSSCTGWGYIFAPYTITVHGAIFVTDNFGDKSCEDSL